MTKFIELLVVGISQGFIYALIAMGMALLFKASNAVNFAHGSMLLGGAYLVARYHETLGFAGALLLSCTVMAIFGVLIEILLVRRIRGRDTHALFLMTVGLDILMATDLAQRIGPRVLPIGAPWGNRTVDIAGFTLPLSRLLVIVVAITLVTAFFVAFQYTTWGVSMRAAAEDPETAALVGVRTGQSSAVSWAVAAILATIAGVFFVSFPSPGLESTTGLATLKAFPAMVIGGMDSIGGAVIGGLIVGIAETAVAGYQSDLLFLGRGLSEIVPYLLMFAVLLLRPSGLFGAREVSRV